jgi:beta-glucosidase-like glycosyl hydrolase
LISADQEGGYVARLKPNYGFPATMTAQALGERNDPGIYPIDFGCLWGGQLTALRIDTIPQRFNLPCPQLVAPG